MKTVVEQVAAEIPIEIDEIDIDDSAELSVHLTDQIPLLCIDGRRAFKYRVTTKQLERRLRQDARRSFFRWLRK
jgi:hypothetical protein